MEHARILEVAPGAAREPWIPVLALADEPEPLRRYVDDGVLYGAVDASTGRSLGAVLVISLDDGVAELRAVAVHGDEQGRGVGSWMVGEVCSRLRVEGRRIVVGTASSGTRQLAFYQRLGFRVTHVERDFFTPARGYPTGLEENGIPIRDMVWMELQG